MECEGLYFPKVYKCEVLSVVKFRVSWSDSLMMFMVWSEPLLRSAVETSITDIVRKEKQSLGNCVI